ncbi:MAG: ERCC4 domain-containing protein [Candidatus Loosdrechtia sp.]|uniref:ERCC4 domain-containing protein n=1 Tax=Candidatus Loosdrechtia sp. TaxID=3101272 RepID=UPI003A75E524|nr:MAG: ERCC4 domain-containing protein [Candidatus Jettenia sp. AMX2]
MSIVIEIDYRERESGIIELLQAQENFSVEVKRLPAGDYLVNNYIAFERKTTKDFVLSIIDGRLFSQASRLKRYAGMHCMIIEGTDLFYTGYKIDSQAIKGALVSLSVSWQIPLIFSKSSSGTAEILIMAGDQHARYHDEIIKRTGRRPKRIQTKRLYFLQGLPGIGPEMAKRMLNHFGSIERIINADVQKLTCVEGIGKKKASVIRKIIE